MQIRESSWHRTMKAPSMAAPTLEFVPAASEDEVLPGNRVKKKREYSIRRKDEDGNSYFEDHRDRVQPTTSWDDPEPGVSSGSSDNAEGASDDDTEASLASGVPNEWNSESLSATQALIDHIDYLSAGRQLEEEDVDTNWHDA
jgi:hypothetical protein